MYDASTLISAAVAALIIGALLGALLNRRLSPSAKKQRDLEHNLEQVLQQQKDYQHQVAEHFTDTAKLLNNLSESYRDVHNHLASGANALCDDNSEVILQSLPAGNLEAPDSGPDLSSVRQPLDYAPKSSPFETGMLNEEFGLEKQPVEEEEAEDAIPVPVPEPVTEKA